MKLLGNLYRIALVVRKPSGEEFDIVRMVVAESGGDAVTKVEAFCKAKGWAHALSDNVTTEQYEVWM